MLRCGKLYRTQPTAMSRLSHAKNIAASLMLLFVCCLLTGTASDAFAQTTPAAVAPAWLTGIALKSQLENSTVSFRLSGQSLHDAIGRLSDAYQVAMYLDRRVDPGQIVDLQVQKVPLEQGLKQLGRQHHLAISQLGSVIYFGPEESAADLRTLAALASDEVDRLPAQRKAVLLKPTSMKWNELATPRTLIEHTAQSAGLKLVGFDRVPHDLWPAANWPAMSVIDRLSLFAIGFNLQVRFSKTGDAVAFVPRVSPARIVRQYPASSVSNERIRSLEKQFPTAEFKLVGSELFVRSRIEEQQQIKDSLNFKGSVAKPMKDTPAVASKPAAGIQVYTLNVQNKPLRPVLETLAKQMNLTLQLDEAALQAAGINSKQLISFQVKSVQRDELWKAALAPVGLTCTFEGEVIKVVPLPKDEP